MVTLLIAENTEKIKAILGEMLSKIGNTKIGIVKQEDVVKIIKKDDIKESISLRDKLIELEDSLYGDKKGYLYKAILEVIEKPLLEHILERTDGNQLKAARILGINRNTMRSKIRRLKIDPLQFKGTP